MSQSSFVCTQLNGFKKMIKYFYLTINRIRTGITTLGQSGPGSNCNEKVLCKGYSKSSSLSFTEY